MCILNTLFGFAQFGVQHFQHTFYDVDNSRLIESRRDAIEADIARSRSQLNQLANVRLKVINLLAEDIDQEFYKKIREYSASESKEKCLKTISLLKNRWEKYWYYLSNSDSFKIIRENRDYLVHSYSNTVESFPSINKIKKVLRITTWFIKKIDYIINNCSFSYDTELEKVRYISTEYWDLINK